MQGEQNRINRTICLFPTIFKFVSAATKWPCLFPGPSYLRHPTTPYAPMTHTLYANEQPEQLAQFTPTIHSQLPRHQPDKPDTKKSRSTTNTSASKYILDTLQIPPKKYRDKKCYQPKNITNGTTKGGISILTQPWSNATPTTTIPEKHISTYTEASQPSRILWFPTFRLFPSVLRCYSRRTSHQIQATSACPITD